MTHPGDRVVAGPRRRADRGVIAVALVLRRATPRVLLTLLVLAPLVAMLLVLWRLGDIQTAALRALANAFGPLYVGGGLGALVLLRRDARSAARGAAFVVLALMLAWASDTGAYFAGRFLGKHKLYEAVSPKKTVEGAIGGLAGERARRPRRRTSGSCPSLPLVDAVVLALVAGALGQAGDLGESLLKRSFGVKDSGGIVPGHGGILDRVDALLVTGTHDVPLLHVGCGCDAGRRGRLRRLTRRVVEPAGRAH